MTTERDESHVDTRFDPAEHGFEPDNAERDDEDVDAQEEGSREHRHMLGRRPRRRHLGG